MTKYEIRNNKLASEVKRNLQRQNEYGNKSSRVVVEDDISLYKINTYTGFHGRLFLSKYMINIEDYKLEVVSKFALGKFLFRLFLTLLTFWGGLALIILIATIENKYAKVADYVITAIFDILPVMLWIVDRIFYVSRPKKIIMDFLNEKILSNNIVDDWQNYNTEPVAVEIGAMSNKRQYDAQTTTAYIEQRSMIRRRIVIVQASIMGIFFIGMLFVQKSAPCLAMIFLGTFFFLMLITYVSLTVLQQQERKMIARYGKPYTAMVKDEICVNYKENLWSTIYEFSDEFGSWHKVQGMDQYKKKRKSTESRIGSMSRIWYAPMYSVQVLAGNEKAYVKPLHKDASFMAGLLVMIVMTMFFYGVGLMQFLDEGIKDPVGNKLTISWNSSYIEEDITQADIESDTVQWICNTYALRAREDGGEYYTIGIFEPTEENKESTREYLDQVWGIHDRASAIKVIDHVLEHGTREKYRKFVKELEKDGWLELTKEEIDERIKGENLVGEEYRYKGACLAYKAYGENGVDAWDYCRMTRIAGECYVAGYFTLKESMDQCLPIAKQIQQEFLGWDNMNDSYIYGYMYWIKSEEDGKIMTEVWSDRVFILDNKKDGPFSLNYNTELEDTWSEQ